MKGSPVSRTSSTTVVVLATEVPMKPLSPLLCLLLVTGSAYAQSQLPACQGGSPARWNNCTGRWLNTNGDKYEGEWRDGKPSGFGVQTFASKKELVLDQRVAGVGVALVLLKFKAPFPVVVVGAAITSAAIYNWF